MSSYKITCIKHTNEKPRSITFGRARDAASYACYMRKVHKASVRADVISSAPGPFRSIEVPITTVYETRDALIKAKREMEE